ncbi:hypothetical protein CY35_02G157900 [Sphagnum magellanicum]|nr:hypothetical protein CY35_02G157900 [Sphagnum magellanicum]
MVVKCHVCKGILDYLQGLVWQLVSGNQDLLLMNQGVYEQLKMYETSAVELDIIRDISQTFPSRVFPQQRHVLGQCFFYNILKAYAVYDRNVGYVQGMGFLVGWFLLYMSEENGVLHAPMEGLYLQYLIQFERLVKKLVPQMGEHFEKETINLSMYASQWFIIVFSYSFLFSLALRIWDVFPVELPFEKLVHALHNFPRRALQPNTFLPLAYNIKVPERLEELSLEYEHTKNHNT